MTSDSNTWNKRQLKFDRWFPFIFGLVIIVSGLLAGSVVWQANRNEIFGSDTTPTSQLPALSATSHSSAGPINLRTITVSQLAKLGGLGTKKASDVVALIQESKIHSVSDLQKVKGIGPKTYEKLVPLLVWQ